jgi:hypothetical protein
MTETVLLVPADLADDWRAAAPGLFGPVRSGDEELVEAAHLATAALQLIGNVADVGGVALLAVSVRRWLVRRRDDGEDKPLEVGLRRGDERRRWLILSPKMSDDEIVVRLEEFLASRDEQTDVDEPAPT